MDFTSEIAGTRVLDPACGSGNFLYVALKQLLDLEKAVGNLAADLGLTRPMPIASPEQLHGIEVNEYAYELAQVTVWIGYIQWLRDNGFGEPSQPILQHLNTIERKDAILAFDAAGKPVEPEGPGAVVISGTPPFLGGNKVRRELGDTYVDSLFALYDSRVPAFADLVCYWFERARALIEQGKVQRAGLLATNSIRTGVNRHVLERIKQSGDMFMAWADRPWIVEGAAVRVTIVGFDDGSDLEKRLDGARVPSITPDLRSDIDLTHAKRLRENLDIAFIGDTKKGKFDIPSHIATQLLKEPININGWSNADVVRPWINGLDIARRPRGMWIIDFGVNMTEADAALYKEPYEYVRLHVKPERDKVRNQLERRQWWLHARPAPDLRNALRSINRYIATPRNGRHRIFVFVPVETLPDGQIVAIARDSEYWLGVMHGRPHEIWSLRMGSWLGVGNDPRYTTTTCFETYPFPWPPGTEPHGDPRVEAIAAAAQRLVALRDAWLNPPDLSEAELKKRTLTNLYNARPAWLDEAHRTLDAAVFAAYGWPADLSDEEILARLLALNLERAAAQGGTVAATDDEDTGDAE